MIIKNVSSEYVTSVTPSVFVLGGCICFLFRVEFLYKRTVQPCFHALPTSKQEERRRRERESALHCEPDRGFIVIQLHRRDNSCRASSPVFVPEINLRHTHSHDFKAQVNFPSFRLSRLDQNSTSKVLKTERNPFSSNSPSNTSV